MKLAQKLELRLTGEEMDALGKADEILKNIIDLLIDNKENGHTPWQDGLIAPNCFWDLCHHVHQIDDEELIP